MAHGKVAAELAEFTGKSFDEAKRLVDEIGEKNARELLNVGEDAPSSKSGSSGSLWPSTKSGKALTGGAIVGGSATAYQGLQTFESRYDAKQAEDSKSVVEKLIESDMSPEQKRKFMELYANSAPNDGGGGNDDDGGDDDGIFDGLELFGDSTTTVLILVAVVVLVIAMESDGGLAPPTIVNAGGR